MHKEAQKILDMIETVSPDDTGTLDEIDLRVACYIRGDKFLSWDGTILEYKASNPVCTVQMSGFADIKYTRSRDTLKSIRPEGWLPKDICSFSDGCTYVLSLGLDKPKVFSKMCATEELAELHAIIQAIAYERGEE